MFFSFKEQTLIGEAPVILGVRVVASSAALAISLKIFSKSKSVSDTRPTLLTNKPLQVSVSNQNAEYMYYSKIGSSGIMCSGPSAKIDMSRDLRALEKPEITGRRDKPFFLFQKSRKWIQFLRCGFDGR